MASTDVTSARAFLAALVLAATATASACGQADAVASLAGETAVTEPARVSGAPGGGASVPPLPAVAASIRSATLEFVSTRLDARGSAIASIRQTFVRAPGRVSLRSQADRGEWLFVQNPVAPERVAGAFAHHPDKAVVEYEETDLLIELGVRGWADVITFRVDQAALGTMRRTGRTTRIAGLDFDQYIASTDGDGLGEVWWNADELIPGETYTRRGADRIRTRLASIAWEAPPGALSPLPHRFPSYAVRGPKDDWHAHR